MMLLEKISQNLTTVISEVLETMFLFFWSPSRELYHQVKILSEQRWSSRVLILLMRLIF